MSDNQSPLHQLILKPAKQLLDLKKYMRTRKAVRQGEELADFDDKELALKGLLSPWPFNIQETVYATLPTFIIIGFMNFLFGKPEITTQLTEETTQRDKIFNGIYESTLNFLDTFTIPIITTVAVLLIAWGSLKKKDTSPQKKKHAMHSYLYYDGAHGLVPQALIVLCIALLEWFQLRPSMGRAFPEEITIALAVLFYASSIYLVWLIGRKIPKRLFQKLGYSGRVKHFWNKSQPDDPPWSKYTLAVFLGGWPLVAVWVGIIFTISYCFAYVATELKILLV